MYFLKEYIIVIRNNIIILKGDIVQFVDQMVNVAASYTYDAWGNILSKTGTMADINPYRLRRIQV